MQQKKQQQQQQMGVCGDVCHLKRVKLLKAVYVCHVMPPANKHGIEILANGGREGMEFEYKYEAR